MHSRALILALTCVLGASGALAHSKVAKSVPAEGAIAKTGLSEITLGFSKPVRLMLVKVRNTKDKSDVKAEFKPAATFKSSFPFKVAPLDVGAYQVNWTAIAKDGHVMKGELSFKVAQ
ncbi:MAG: copper resistance CopC family protein [Hyphomicrobiaceae bacterium]